MLSANHIKFLIVFLLMYAVSSAQTGFKLKFKNSSVYAGIEIGSKGIKLSVLEIGKSNVRTSVNILKDTTSNTDFISFTNEAFDATLTSLENFYGLCNDTYSIPSDKIYTLFSSGVGIQAQKSGKMSWLTAMQDSLRMRIREPHRTLAAIDVTEEGRLSHLGIVPENKRYSTFLIDIGSGNTKGGYFPNGNTNEFKLFQLTWGTKSTANAAESRLENDKTIANFKRQLGRVLNSQAEDEIIYAVNLSGAYNMSDNIAFSGGIAWALATLGYPQLNESPVVPVTFDEMVALNERLGNDFASFSGDVIAKEMADFPGKSAALQREVGKVHAVFDRKALLSGTGLLLNIMRQFEGVYEKKQFYLVKNGQVGWITAFVNQTISTTQR